MWAHVNRIMSQTVGQCVGALKTSIIKGLTFIEVFVELTVRMMVLLYWITYNRSGHLILLPEILPQVMARKPLMMVLRVSMLLNRYRRTSVLRYMLATLKCSQ
jgi:hypothetical protein